MRGGPLIDSMASLVLQQLLLPVGHPLLDARRVRHLLPLPERVRRRRRRVLGDAPLLQAVPVAVLKWGTVITHHTRPTNLNRAPTTSELTQKWISIGGRGGGNRRQPGVPPKKSITRRPSANLPGGAAAKRSMDRHVMRIAAALSPREKPSLPFRPCRRRRPRLCAVGCGPFPPLRDAFDSWDGPHSLRRRRFGNILLITSLAEMATCC